MYVFAVQRISLVRQIHCNFCTDDSIIFYSLVFEVPQTQPRKGVTDQIKMFVEQPVCQKRNV